MERIAARATHAMGGDAGQPLELPLDSSSRHLHLCMDCREELLPEALEVACGLLGARYTDHALHLLRHAATWQQAEVALYLFRCGAASTVLSCTRCPVHVPLADGRTRTRRVAALVVRTRVLAEASPQMPAAANNHQAMHRALLSLFGQLCSSEGAQSVLGVHPALTVVACRLVEAYAVWFGRVEDAPVTGALQLLLQALEVPQASGSHPGVPFGCIVNGG
jgi:hypothetical protein